MDGELGFVIGAMEVNPEIRLELVIDDSKVKVEIYIYNQRSLKFNMCLCLSL